MKQRQNVINLMTMGVSLLVTLCLAECGMRLIFSPPPHFKEPQESYDFDARIEHRLRPGQVAYTHEQPVSINAHGLRDREYRAWPLPGRVRILGLGDSQTFGNGIPLAHTWPKQLEAALNAHAATSVYEVINAGNPATDTWQHQIILDELVSALHPHAVILAFYLNDVSPSFVPRRRNPEPPNSLTRRLLRLFKRSALLNSARSAWTSLKFARNPSRSHLILAGEPDDSAEAGWIQVERSLGAMKRRTDEAGIPLMLLVLPHRAQVTGDQPGPAYNHRIAEITSSLAISTADLLEPLISAYQTQHSTLFIPWDGHNTGEANAVVAAAAAELVRAALRGQAPSTEKAPTARARALDRRGTR